MQTPTEKLVFEQSIEGLFLRALAKDLTPALKQKLREAGLDVDKKLMPAYTFAQWTRFIGVAGAVIHPALPLEKAYFLLGERMLDGYTATLMGRALLGMVKLLGPKRALLRTQQNFRSGNNYTEVKCVEEGPAQVRLWMNEVGLIRFLTQGILLAGLRAAGAEKPVVEIASFDDAGCTYAIRW